MLLLSGKHFGRRNALEFWIGASAGRKARKLEGERERLGCMKAIWLDRMNSGVCLSFVSTGVSKGKRTHTCNIMGMSGDPWEDRRTLLWLYLLLSLPLVL